MGSAATEGSCGCGTQAAEGGGGAGECEGGGEAGDLRLELCLNLAPAAPRKNSYHKVTRRARSFRRERLVKLRGPPDGQVSAECSVQKDKTWTLHTTPNYFPYNQNMIKLLSLHG